MEALTRMDCSGILAAAGGLAEIGQNFVLRSD
jgi:hypothetical protein